MKVRAWMALALAGMLLGAARAEGPLCVATDAFTGLVTEAGEEILTGVEDAFCVREGALYAAGSRGAYRLYDASGTALGDEAFAMIADAGDCLIYRQGGLYGAMDARGSVILPAEWTQLASDGAGGFLALDTDPLDESPDAILRVSRQGEATPTGVMTSMGLSALESGLMPVMTANGRYGAIDARGEWAIQAKWMYLGPFERGRAKVAGPGGMGLIDATGAEVVHAVYEWLARVDGIVAAGKADCIDVFSGSGAMLYSIKGDYIDASVIGSRLLVRDESGVRLYDEQGAMIGAFGADFNGAPGLNGQLIATEGAWGDAGTWLMDPNGSAASGRFQRILPLAGGRYAFIETPGIAYYSADLDRVQTSWDYDGARCGLMDERGAVLVPARYREICALSGDRLLMTADGEALLTDLDGRVVKRWAAAADEAATGE